MNIAIVPGLMKNIQESSKLRVFHIMNYKFDAKCW
jgi:hypothetical protein